MWWFSNRVFGLHKLASRFRIVKEECHQCVVVVVVVAQCCLCSHLLLAAFSTKTDYVFRKTHRFLYIFEFLSTVPAWSFGKCFCHLPVTLQNLSRDLVSLRGRVLTYPRVYFCGWLFFFLNYYSLEVWVWFFFHNNWKSWEPLKWITNCCYFLHSVSYLQSQGVCPVSNNFTKSYLWHSCRECSRFLLLTYKDHLEMVRVQECIRNS